MGKTRYLYGASVQGIQSFIFQTNRLKDIVGASDIVEKICTDFFYEFTEGKSVERIVNAAGNIKCIFDNENDCRDVVLRFPKKIREIAPTVTISQAVVKFCENDEFKAVSDELENKLHAQRNRPAKSLVCGLMAVERSRITGLPAVEVNAGEFIDEGTLVKRKGGKGLGKDLTGERTLNLCKKLFGRSVTYKDIALDTKDLTGNNDWIAVVHADGNGLGNIVSKISSNPEELRKFSEQLDRATVYAAREACGEYVGNGGCPPIRPVVLGGDDLTVVCRGSIAVGFTRKYLECFEEETAKMDVFGKPGLDIGGKLTACAGIAFIKSSYPFYYGYELAEKLCDIAKKDAKSEEMKPKDGEVPSCLMFHKVQSSFVEDFSRIKDKELTSAKYENEDKDKKKEVYVSYMFGPYYLHVQEGKDRATIDELVDNVGFVGKEENGPLKTSVRQWLTLMAKDPEAAAQKRKRAKTILTGECRKRFADFVEEHEHDKKNEIKCVAAYDILSLHSIIYQNTK